VTLATLLEPSRPRPQAPDQTYYRPIPEDARETRFLCTINAPNQSRLKALVEVSDLGRHNTLRDELIQGKDFIVMPPEWWPDISCPRRHGWWVQAVDSVILTRCKRCSGMVQLTFMDSASKTCHSCRSRAEPRNTGLASKPAALTRSCPTDPIPLRPRRVQLGGRPLLCLYE